MKRWIMVLVAVFFALSMSACDNPFSRIAKDFGKIANDIEEGKKSQKTESKGKRGKKDDAPQIEDETLLMDFVTGYRSAKSNKMGEIQGLLEEDNELNPLDAGAMMASTFLEMNLMRIAVYDSVYEKLPSGRSAMFPKGEDFEIKREAKGDVLHFGYEHTFTADHGDKKKGDYNLVEGKFDVKNQSLTYKEYVKSESGLESLKLYEINRNAEHSYSSRILHINPENHEDALLLLASYAWFDEKDAENYVVRKINADIKDVGQSIYGVKNKKASDMEKFEDHRTAIFEYYDGKLHSKMIKLNTEE